MQIVFGSAVTMHFSLALADGMVVESSFDDKPVSFVMGDGSIDEGLELALIGLRAGDKQTLTLMPGQAFGARDQGAIQTLPLDRFPVEMQLAPGQIIGFAGEDGEDIPGAVLAIKDDQVEIDFNHPLAGREIIFKVRVISVDNPATNAG